MCTMSKARQGLIGSIMGTRLHPARMGRVPRVATKASSPKRPELNERLFVLPTVQPARQSMKAEEKESLRKTSWS